MKIIRLQGENVKKMKAFDITPAGHTVVLSGKNGAGKSSVLDAITLLFAGKSSEAAKLTTRPIHAGAKRAMVTADIGEYVVTRTWTEKDTYLEVTSKEGASFKSPQAMLDKIIGELSFDPMQFARMKPAEQKEALLSIVKLPIDLDKWEAEYKVKYDLRAAARKEADAAEAIAKNLKFDTSVPAKEISISDLMAELEKAQKEQSTRESLEIAEKENIRIIADLEKELAERKEGLAKIQAALKTAPPLADVQALKERISNAESVNAKVRANADCEVKNNAWQKKKAEFELLESELDGMKKQKQEALAQASYPVPGLSFSDDGVTFKQGDIEVPFGQLSTALQTKISMAMAMAANPQLKVIRISDGSLLDDETMKAVEEMAVKNDYQVWIEKVDSSGKVGIYIEDGEIAATNHSPNAA